VTAGLMGESGFFCYEQIPVIGKIGFWVSGQKFLMKLEKTKFD
jgi:hypothetical protein